MKFKTIAEVRAANKAAGRFFFEPKTMKYFRSRIVSKLYAGRYFITSEQPPESRLKFTIREVEEDASIHTTKFGEHDTLEGARIAVRELVRELAKGDLPPVV